MVNEEANGAGGSEAGKNDKPKRKRTPPNYLAVAVVPPEANDPDAVRFKLVGSATSVEAAQKKIESDSTIPDGEYSIILERWRGFKVTETKSETSLKAAK